MPPTYRQQPTLQNTRIRTAHDALLVFYGVARNVLTLLSRRLDAEERRHIGPGNVYVWEDRSASTSETTGLSMERWTDGMSWGPSRIRDEFLFYYQRDPQSNEHPNPSNPSGSSAPLHDADRLIKQTFSVFVSLPEDRAQDITRKWHLTAYFNQRSVDKLDLVENIPDVGRATIPEGLFRSARSNKGRRDDPRRTPSGGQLMGPGDQGQLPPPTAGALYTIFPSSASAEPLPIALSQVEPAHPGPSRQALAYETYPMASTSRAPYSHPHMQAGPSALPPPHTPPYYPAPRAPPPGPSLVPLQQLEAISRTTWRDPTDAQLLQQLSGRRQQGTAPAEYVPGVSTSHPGGSPPSEHRY